MNIGKMNSRIKIEVRTYAIVSGKKVYEPWEEYYNTWCEVLDLIGQEKYDAYNSKLENSLKFKCRLCLLLKNLAKDIRLKTIGKEYRIMFNEMFYNIVFIDTLGNSKTEIMFQAIAVG
ncbi:phage head closure protein [Clostridium intestinale]|uniref:Phage head closure protein n=1 Tax=Clostridium intestinale TaxID=36845 RepID=A0A7D7A393_9CLOT|nr:phage head closure protein [Clostridium intestinale]QLY82235.1 phage head closure protein [Clostridium intestinale]